MLARFWEHQGVGGQVSLTLDWAPSPAQAVDPIGRRVDAPVSIAGGRVTVTAAPWQAVTLRLVRPDRPAAG